MARLIYDIETNGLLDKVNLKVHCIVTRDIDTNTVRCYYNEAIDCPEYPPAGTIEQGVAALEVADLRAGHNITCFDEIVLSRLYGMKPAKCAVDTITGMRIIYPDEHLYDQDSIAHSAKRNLELPKEKWGSHSLESWGIRLKCHKDDYGKQTADDPWAVFTPEMLRYCVQDVRVTHELYKVVERNIVKGGLTMRALRLEMPFALILQEQMEDGIGFDEAGALALYGTLSARRAELHEILTREVEPFTNVYFTKVKKERKEKKVPFNPGSRMHVVRLLKERFGWVPEKFTKGGAPEMKDETLESLPYEGIDGIREYFKVCKVMTMISNPPKKSGWLEKVKKGRIHGRINHNAAVTSRCSHSSPPISGTPKVHIGKDKKPVLGWKGGFGYECRSLFRPREGWKQVGCDLSGLEIRMLAHWMAEFDGGEYAEVACEGDVHARNMIAAGITDRDKMKTLFYAFLYGAGDKKLGRALGGNKATGAAFREKFLAGLPALARLVFTVLRMVRQHHRVRLPDGRFAHARSEHSALNTLLQGSGAIVVKLTTVLLRRKLEALGYRRGVDFCQMAHVHDEVQFECRPEIAEIVGKTAVESIAEAGRLLEIRCPLTGEYKIGNTWAECH